LTGIKSIQVERSDLSCARTGESLMNASLLTADRVTHVKVVAMGLSAALVIALVAITTY
jgi:hypothetical protein